MYIGIDIGGTNIAVGLVNYDGQIVNTGSIPTLKHEGYEQVVKSIYDVLEKVVIESGFMLKHVKAIGIGCPGVLDIQKGIILYASNLNFNNVPIRTEIQKYIDVPVFLENDANCAAFAESLQGASKDVYNSVTITLGTGVGCGVILDRKIYRGFNNSAGEMGHSIIQIDGEQCTCGRKGCWEAYASATALKRQAISEVQRNPESLIMVLAHNDVDNINGEIVFEAARKGDRLAKDVVHNYTKYVAEGLTNVINILAPEVIIIGGGISAQGEYLLMPIREYVQKYVYCKNVEQTQIKVAQLGNSAGIIGAAMLGEL